MKWSSHKKKGTPPVYQREASPTRAQEKVEHSQGWPHFDRQGNCICFCKRCFGPGCICSACAGIQHVNCPNADHWSDGLGNIYPKPLPQGGRHAKVRT